MRHFCQSWPLELRRAALVMSGFVVTTSSTACGTRRDLESENSTSASRVDSSRLDGSPSTITAENTSWLGDAGHNSAVDSDASGPTGAADTDIELDPVVTTPSNFPPLPAPVDNPPDPLRTELGRRLFYDRRLSRTGEVACADCHLQEHAFADPARFSRGVEGKTGTRNAPGLMNLAYQSSFFWDGGVPTLELQVIAPIRNPLEMDTTLTEIASRLALDDTLAPLFQAAFDEGPSDATIPVAIANFMRSLVSANSEWDKHTRGEPNSLSAAALRGSELFHGERAECFHCHVGFNFTSNAFKNNGTRPDDPDPGRMGLTLKALDAGKFKVPTLRNIALTAPYMHDGSLATIDDVIEHYDKGGEGHPNTDANIHPLSLTAEEKADLRAFLVSLTDLEFVTAERYAAPPSTSN